MQWVKNNFGVLIILGGILVYLIFFVGRDIQGERGEPLLTESICQVEIKGEVHHPGIYTCKDEERVVDVITKAGGLTINADVSQINRSEKVYDEMEILIPRKSGLSNDEELLVRYIQVEIKGEVKQPGVYKCQEQMVLMDLVELAGGFRSAADYSQINLAKTLTHGEVYTIPPIQSIMLNVEVKGAVHYPGVYTLPKGALVNDLILKAGGVLATADMSNIALVEELVDHQVVVIEYMDSGKLFPAVDLKGAVKRPGVYYFQEGDRVIDVIQQAGGFLTNADCRDMNLSMLLKDGEMIVVPSIPEDEYLAVDIKGEVKYPGVYHLPLGSRVEDAIMMAGGLKPEADIDAINLSKSVANESMILIPKLEEKNTYMYVQIGGEIMFPGIYACLPGDRLIHLVNKAGGLTSQANQDLLNLSRILEDEEVIYIPNHNEKTILVSIQGEVYHPGVYEMVEQSNLLDLIRQAGGLTSKADIQDIDANRILEEGIIYEIPSIDEYSPFLPNEEGGKVNINNASTERLQMLDGIGLILAERIVNYREEYGPFRSIEEIKNVSGIGDSLYEKIKEDIII